MEKTGCCITNDSLVSAPVSRQHCHCHNCGPTLGISTNCGVTCYSLYTLSDTGPLLIIPQVRGQAQIKVLMKYLWIEEGAAARQSRSADAGWAGLGWAGLVSAAIPLAETVIIQRVQIAGAKC